MNKTFLFLALILFLFLVQPRSQAETGKKIQRPILMSHRGANREADENTLMAYSLAADYGMDVIECDPRLTSDGVFVIMHDSTVDRTTDGTGKVAKMTLEQFKALRTKNGEKAPTLKQVFELAKQKDFRVYLDTKIHSESDMEKLAAIIIESNVQDRVILGLWKIGQQKWFRKNHPEFVTSIPYPAPVATLKYVKKFGAQWVGTVVQHATPKMIRRADKYGLKVVTLPLNDEKLIRRKIAEGMHVILTDDPKLLRKIIDDMFADTEQ